jgi:small-conductance mechanosensitive channel
VLVSFLLAVSVSSRVFAGVKEGSAGSFEQTVISFLLPVIELFAGNSWLQGGAAIAATFTIASFVTWTLFKIVKKITSRTKVDFDDQITVLARPPVYYTFLVSGITYGLSLMPLSAPVHQIGIRSIQSLGVIVWVLFFSRLSSLLLNRLSLLSHRYAFIERRTVTLFENVAKVVIFAVGLYLIFVIWRIDMTAWLASAGIVGIAVGFAAKDTLSNLFSGVFILADAPYKVGDFIVMDNGSRGQVTNIGLRSTRILTRDDVEVTIPNSIMGNSTIVNQSGGPSEKMRVRLMVGVAYGSDIDLVKDVMLTIAQNEPQVCSTPEPSLRFRVFGASSLDFELRCWVYHPRYCSRVIDALNSKIYKEFERLQIEIPYTKQDLYIKGLPESFANLSGAGGVVSPHQE